MTEAVIIQNQSIYLLRKSMDWFLYDNGLRHERVKYNMSQDGQTPCKKTCSIWIKSKNYIKLYFYCH